MMIVRCNAEFNSWNNLLTSEVENNPSVLVARLAVRRGVERILSQLQLMLAVLLLPHSLEFPFACQLLY